MREPASLGVEQDTEGVGVRVGSMIVRPQLSELLCETNVGVT